MKHVAAVLIAGVVALGGPALAQDSSNDPARKVRDRLASMRITLDFNNARLDDVIAYFQEFSGLNFHLEAEARAKEIEDGSKVTIKVRDVSLRTALKLVLNPRDLGCVFRDGVLVIATKAKLGTQAHTRVYDVRDLVFQLRDFMGPAMELRAPGGTPLAGVIFTMEEEPKGELTKEFLVDLIKMNTGDRSWEDNAAASITEISGLLIVSQSKAIHDEVQRLLDLLRQYK